MNDVTSFHDRETPDRRVNSTRVIFGFLGAPLVLGFVVAIVFGDSGSLWIGMLVTYAFAFLLGIPGFLVFINWGGWRGGK
jgi:hypothetical protein